MKLKELRIFLDTHLADGTLTDEMEIKSRTGGYEAQHLAHVSIERDHNGIEYLEKEVLNFSADP